MSDRVLLTGISGFLGGHIALRLLNAGFAVRGSLRNPDRADAVRTTLTRAGADVARLDFVTLDLTAEAGWFEAARDCRYLLHTASPFVLNMPKDRMELVGPAVAGTERALDAALHAGVERVVLTSSMAAMAYGHDRARTTPFTAADWTNLEGKGINAYVESKTRAEKRAWEIMRAADRSADLAVINPAVILGPLLDDDPGTSAALILRLMDGSVPAAPRIAFALVDVRDVAEAHVTALTAPGAGGQRFPMAVETLSMLDVAQAIRQAAPEKSGRVPKWTAPDWLVRLVGAFDRDIRGNLGELGITKRLDSSAVIALLGHDLIPAQRAISDTVASLAEQRLI